MLDYKNTLNPPKICSAIRCRLDDADEWCKCQVSESARVARAAAGTFNIRRAVRRCCNSRRNVNNNWLQDNKAALAAVGAGCGVHVANNQLCKQETVIHTST